MLSFLIVLMRATCSVRFIHLDFNILFTLSEEYKLGISSLFTFLQSPVTSNFWVPYVLCTVLKHSQSVFFLHYQRPSFTPIQNQRQNYISVVLIFKFLISTQKDKYSDVNGSNHYLSLINTTTRYSGTSER
jgi:hypothetical protein